MRRNKAEIIRDILKVIKDGNGIKITKLLSKTNYRHRPTFKILKLMGKEGLINYAEPYYVITGKGIMYLYEITRMLNQLDTLIGELQ